MIVGGESGPKSRACEEAWLRDIVGQCRAAGVACFVKQFGRKSVAYVVPGDVASGGIESVWLHDRAGGDPSEWPADLRVREFPNPNPVPKET